MDIANNRGETPAFLAALSNNLYCLRILIQSGADINRTTHNGVTPAMTAAQHGHLDSLRILWADGSPITHDPGKLAHTVNWAQRHGHLEVAELFLALQASDQRSEIDASIGAQDSIVQPAPLRRL